MSSIYQPVERNDHSTVQVGDYLYMWGGDQPGLPYVHNSEKKKSMCSVIEVCHIPTGEWVQKPTTGDPPLGVCACAVAVIRNEIYFFGGWCNHDRHDCCHNSLYSFNVDTLNWKELSPTTPQDGPMMKSYCHMIALKLNGEGYLAVIGGYGPLPTSKQPGAQYIITPSSGFQHPQCNEVHLYRLKTGEWTSPTVIGDRPPPISNFTLTSINDTTGLMFGGRIGDGKSNGSSNDVYAFKFTETSVKCTKYSNPGGSAQWPMGRGGHSSVLINCSSGPHLLVVGGESFSASDCWLLNINKMKWKELTNVPDSVTKRCWHSLSVWNETQTTHWIIEFGGLRDYSLINDTKFIEITSSAYDLIIQSVLDINEYQKRKIQDAVEKWMDEGSVDVTVTRVNMLGAPGAGKTCSQCLLLNQDPPTNDTSTPIACPAVRATRVAVSDKIVWNQVTPAKLREKLAANLAANSQKKKTKKPPLPVVFTLLDNTQPATEIPGPPDTSPTPHEPNKAVSSETKIIKESKEYHNEVVVQQILATKPKGIHISDHWLYIIDSGGQPAYQELLPLFTRAASLNITELDLSKPFNERLDLMYRIDGQYSSCHSKSTQLSFFQSAISTGASFKPLDISCISKKPTYSMHLVLGTHYDMVSDATLKEKEEILKSSMSSLESYLQNCVIHQSDDDSIIFPVNTIATSEERAKYSEEICQAIRLNGSDASLKIKIPIRWFAFELSLPEQSIVSVKEALSIGERYGMNEEDTKQALRYFHDMSLMLYYPEVTNVIFINFKPILEILSQLLAITYVTKFDALALITDKPLPPKIIKNLKEGFFNEDIFEHLKSKSVVFSLPEFQLPHLIRLLLHLNIITKLEDEPKGHYFIPYALPSYNEPVSVKETNANPLVIVWREEESKEILPVPTGLFPLTITYLLKQKNYIAEIPPSMPEYYKFRDAMSLKITFEGKEDTLHLINRYTHIEVYFAGPTQHCPLVRKLLMTAIDNSSDAMHLKHNYVNAFACPYNSSCYSIVRPREDGIIVNCTVCPVSATISSDHWYWFESGPDESNNGTQIKQDNDQPSDENLLLDKKPLMNDLVRLFKSSAAQYMLIGAALDVEVDDLLPTPGTATTNLILVFQRWIDSNKGVTWRKVLQVCEDYQDKLVKAKADVESFLSSDRAYHKYKHLEDDAGTETDEFDRERIEKWLKEGEVELKVTRINMHGAPGAGKTCSQHLLLNEAPPAPPDKLTDSTPIACRAVQATRISVDKNKTWQRVSIKELLNQLASTEVDEPPKHEVDVPAHADKPSLEEPIINELTKDEPTETQSFENELTEIETINSSENMQVKKKPIENKQAENKTTDKKSTEKKRAKNKPTNAELVKQMLHAFKTGESKKLSTNWVYFIDSGGQPAYRELLPLFTRAAALNIITIDLTKGLDEKYQFQYRINQNTIPIKTKLEYSNRDIIRLTISSEAMLNPVKFPYVSESKMSEHSCYLILGTRIDDKLVTKEKFKEMNESLREYIANDKVIPQNKHEGSIIFPVNTLLPAGSKEREEASVELCTAISAFGVAMTIKLPIRLFAFEIALQLEADKKKRSFLTKKEVIEIGYSHQLDKESDINHALQYLHNVTIILYFGDVNVLKNLIFVDPKPILDVLSRLIAIAYVDYAKLYLITDSPPSKSERDSLINFGRFKEGLLNIVGKQIFNIYFNSSHMITLLKHLHIIAEIGEGDYFFPCALPSCDKLNDPPKKIRPLLIAWEINNSSTTTLAIPQGLFPLTIIHLLEKKGDIDFSPVGKEYYRYNDAMSLRVYNNHFIHIINRYTHIEIHFRCDCRDSCQIIRELVTEAIKKSCKDLNCNDDYIFAFKCPQKERYCIVRKDDKPSWCSHCTHCEIQCNVLESDDSYRCWFFSTSPGAKPLLQDAPTKRPTAQSSELDTSHLVEIRDLLKKHGYSGVDYYDLGLRLGLLPGTLDVIEKDNKGDTKSCLRKCLTEWLEQKDNVKSKGVPTYDTLIRALRDEGENIVADGIEKDINSNE